MVDIEQLTKGLSESFSQNVVEKLWESAVREGIEVMLVGAFSINVEMWINGPTCGEKVISLLDTGAQSNLISLSLIEKLGLQHHIDTHYVPKLMGLGGKTQTYGLLPYIETYMNGHMIPLSFTVVDQTPNDHPILGIAFMRFYGVAIDFNTNKMTLGDKDIPIIVTNN